MSPAREPLALTSGGSRLDGWIELPDGQRPHPTILACSGYQGLKEMHPARFARSLVPSGFACVGFDYRGFGTSEGEVGRLVPEEQVEDVLAVTEAVAGHPAVDAERLGIVGWALGGGIAVSAAAFDQRLRAVAALNAVADGRRSTRFGHGEASWARLLERIESDRGRREKGEASELVDPFDILPLDPVTRAYVDAQLEPHPGFHVPVSLEAAERLLAFRPIDVVDRIAPRPLLVVHGAGNGLYPADEARDLYERAGEPKRLVLLENTGHTEWMSDEHPTFLRAAQLVAEFLTGALGPGLSVDRVSA